MFNDDPGGFNMYRAGVFEYQILIFEYRAVTFEYQILVFEYRAGVFEYQILIFEYRAVIFEYQILIFEYLAVIFEYQILIFVYPPCVGFLKKNKPAKPSGNMQTTGDAPCGMIFANEPKSRPESHDAGQTTCPYTLIRRCIRAHNMRDESVLLRAH